MESHLSMGDRPSALRQYERCARTLREELDIEPMEETRRLYDLIRQGHVALIPELPLGGEGVRRDIEVAGLVAEVDGAITALHALMDRLERTRSTLALDAPAAPGVLGAPRKRRRLTSIEAAGA
jgi:hypothetical protein